MSDTGREEATDKLNSKGEEPAAESGAGYGSHAPEPDEADDEAESRE